MSLDVDTPARADFALGPSPDTPTDAPPRQFRHHVTSKRASVLGPAAALALVGVIGLATVVGPGDWTVRPGLADRPTTLATLRLPTVVGGLASFLVCTMLARLARRFALTARIVYGHRIRQSAWRRALPATLVLTAAIVLFFAGRVPLTTDPTAPIVPDPTSTSFPSPTGDLPTGDLPTGGKRPTGGLPTGPVTGGPTPVPGVGTSPATDIDRDGIEDGDDPLVDTDGNGVDDRQDPTLDRDRDGVVDSQDANVDTDRDGIEDSADPVVDADSNGEDDRNQPSLDLDKDGTPDREDTLVDTDGDGQDDRSDDLVDTNGNQKEDRLERAIDRDGDGVDDRGDPSVDTDNDGKDDRSDAQVDANNDGVDDRVDPPTSGTPNPATSGNPATPPGEQAEPERTDSPDDTNEPESDSDRQLPKPGALFAGIVLSTICVFLLPRLLRKIGRRKPEPATALPVTLDTATPIVFETFADTLTAFDDDPDPRRAIIAAYARLLHGLARSGLPRRIDETPDRFLERCLTSLKVRPEPISTLTGLFARARFSDHPMTPADRDDARASLAAVLADLGQQNLQNPASSKAAV